MSENALQSRIKKTLEEMGCYVVNIRSPITAGTPDLLVCYEGKFFALEVKSFRGKTNPGREKLQRRTREKIQKAGGIAEKVHSVTEAKSVVREIDLSYFLDVE